MTESLDSHRIALGQLNPTVGNFELNSAKILDLAKQAAAAKAVVLALPFGALTGHPTLDLPYDASFISEINRVLKSLASRMAAEHLEELAVILAHVGPAPNRGDLGNLVPQVHVLHRGEAAQIFSTSPVTRHEVAGMRLGVLTQDDLTTPFVSGQQIDLILILGGVAFERGGPEATEKSITDAARISGAPVAFVNLVGGQDELVFPGGSLLVTSNGRLLERAPLFSEHLSITTLNSQGRVAPEQSEPARLYRAITLGLADYVSKNGFTSVAIGMSGGIDSALVAALAADALGGSQIYGLGMPSPFSSEHSRHDAADLARRIGAHYEEIDIGPIMSAFNAEMEMPGVAGENLQARIRGLLLMAASNRDGHLVLAPGNKSELAVGYSTIYGDAVGGYGPIKDLYKTQVWELSRWRNNLALDRDEIPPIPESSLTKPPSAELRPGQMDQDSLPDYTVLDPLLQSHLEDRASRDQLLEDGFEAETVDWMLSAVQRAEWKRRQYPLGPKVSARSFDANRRLPVTNRWR